MLDDENADRALAAVAGHRQRDLLADACPLEGVEQVVDAVDAAGNIGRQGHLIAFDRNGNRTSDTSWSADRVAISAGQQAITGYAADGAALYASTPVAYTRGEGVLNQALAIAPDETDTLIGLGSLALARHQFQDALEWGKRAVESNPYKAASFGIIGAQIDRNSALVSTGLDLRFTPQLSLAARFDGEFSENVTRYAGTARIRFEF